VINAMPRRWDARDDAIYMYDEEYVITEDVWMRMLLASVHFALKTTALKREDRYMIVMHPSSFMLSVQHWVQAEERTVVVALFTWHR